MTLNLLLIPRFIEDGWEVHYIGDKKGIEHQEILKSGLDIHFHSIATGKLRRYFLGKICWIFSKVFWEFSNRFGSCFVYGHRFCFLKGGFVSVPPVVAARLCFVPVLVHESDRSMGLANKIAYKFATKMFTTFEQPKSLVKAQHVGAVTKVRQEQLPIPQELEAVFAQFDPQLPTLLFVGGSAGAQCSMSLSQIIEKPCWQDTMSLI